MVCPHCHTAVREGELVCHACGKLIAPVTRQLSTTSRLMVTTQERVNAAHVRLMTFRIGESSYEFSARDGRKILIGRGNFDKPPTGSETLDLLGMGGNEAGVSRRHAVIRFANENAFLIDLGSTNGTYLNGRRLTAHQEYPVYDGDRVLFGRLEVRLEYA